MIRFFVFSFIGLLAISVSSFGQTNACKLKIIKLEFDKSKLIESGEITDSLLIFAAVTTSVLVDNSDIIKFTLKTDTSCCTSAGQIYVTSHRYVLSNESLSRLSALEVPLCCGIPVALYIDNKEIYRAMLWNVVSSFGNKSLNVILTQNTLMVTNQLPSVPDFRKSILVNKNILPDCLLDKHIGTE